MIKNLPDLNYEEELWKENKLAIGIDEVGRGPIAGPVYISAVAFDPDITDDSKKDILQLDINDSKKLTEKKRSCLYEEIKKRALLYSIESSTVDEINKNGIVPSIEKACLKAVKNLIKKLHDKKGLFKNLKQQEKLMKISILSDAFEIKLLKQYYPEIEQLAIIKGDQKSISIAAASILAKVERDKYMTNLSNEYPKYDWGKNKGYGTKSHCEALKTYGPTPEHRKLFIRKIYERKNN